MGRTRIITPQNDRFNGWRFRGVNHWVKHDDPRYQHGEVKVLFSKDPHPVVDPPTRLGMYAGRLRLYAPKCELIFRDALKRFEKHGYHFHHQATMFGFIADFACLEKPFIIELDGKQHSTKKRRAKDQARDGVFRENGYVTLRFWSSRVYDGLEDIMHSVADYLGVPHEPEP